MKINKFTGQYKFLSNFYIISQGKTAEHVYMASKTIDPKEREAIFDCKTAAQAKRLGRKVTLRPNWDRLKLPFMEKIIRWKFSHKHLADMLIATGDDELIERELTALEKVGGEVKSEMTTRLKRRITSVDGDSTPSVINNFVDNEFLSVDSFAFRQYADEITPDVDMTYTYTSILGDEKEIVVPMTTAFFWPSTKR